MSHRDLVVELQAASDLTEAEANAFDYQCGVARAEVVDRILVRAVEDLGWSLLDEGVVDRVSIEHDGPARARIIVDGAPVTPWWGDCVRSAGGKRVWSYEPDGPAEDA